MNLGISTLTQVSLRSQKVVSAPILLSPSTIWVSPSSSKKIQTGGGKTVKLKVNTVITTDFNQVKQAEKNGKIVQTRSDVNQLLFPTNMNEELKPYIGNDFDMDVVKEGEHLRVILTDRTSSRTLNLTLKPQ
jgi:hypothetical protein